MLLAEQNASVALQYADAGYILENGRVVMEGDAKALSENDDVKGVLSGGFHRVTKRLVSVRLNSIGGENVGSGELKVAIASLTVPACRDFFVEFKTDV
ncbi:MAG: hypothetical protein CM1200mP41_08730 [Gammaproteobacteria bacterium]|nr:MAG: hypothetical protein CM1200mP41_08730 [Gammaproteobacteria bacterium]